MDSHESLTPNPIEYTINGENYNTQDPARPQVKLMLNPTPAMDNSIVANSVRIIANGLKDKKIFIGRQAQEQAGINLDPSIISVNMDQNTRVSRAHGRCIFEPNTQGGFWMWYDQSTNGTRVYQPEILQYENNCLRYGWVQGVTSDNPKRIRVFQGTVLRIAGNQKDKPDSAIWLRFHSPNYSVGRNEIPQRTTDDQILVIERIDGLEAAMNPELETLVRAYSPTVVEPPQDF